MLKCSASNRLRIGRMPGPPLIPVVFDSRCMRSLPDIAEKIEIESPPVPRESEPVKLIFEVRDVEGERERLQSLGIRTLRRPWQQHGEACDAINPEGNIFQLGSSGADARL